MEPAGGRPRPPLPNPLYLLLSLPLVFWLANRIPMLQIGAVVLGVAVFVSVTLSTARIDRAMATPLVILTAMYAYFFLSYLLTTQPIAGFFSYAFIRRDGNFTFAYVPFFVMAMAGTAAPRLARHLFTVGVGAAALVGLMGVLEWIAGLNVLLVRQEPGMRVFTALNQAHNAAGSLYAIAFVLGFSWFLFGDRWHRVPAAAVTLLLFTCLLLTKSRGGLVAAVGAGAFLVYLANDGRFWLTARRLAWLGLLTIPLFFLTGSAARVTTIGSLDFATNLLRLRLWAMALKLFASSPLIGVGFGRFDDLFNTNDLVEFTGQRGLIYLATDAPIVYTDSHAHNSYLHLLAETGIVGLALMLSLWLWCAYRLYRGLVREQVPGFTRVYLAGTLGSIVTLFALAVTEHYMTTPTAVIGVASLTAVALRLCRPRPREPLLTGSVDTGAFPNKRP